MDLYHGSASAPCTSLFAAGIGDAAAAQNQVLQPGVAIPAGHALGALEFNNGGSLVVYGYLVPAFAFPPAAAAQPRDSGARGSSPTRRG
jgi:hypothetical protein